MLGRRNRRIAHRADSIDSADNSHGSEASGSGKEFYHRRTKGIRLKSRVQIPRLRVHIFSVRLLVGKVRESCGRLLSVNRHDGEKQASENKPRCGGLAYSSSCNKSSYNADAIADCIEFIKRSASTREPSVGP